MSEEDDNGEGGRKNICVRPERGPIDVDHGRTAVDGHACAGQKIWVQKKVRGTAQPKRSSRFRQSGDAASPALCLGCRNTIAA